MGTVFWYGDNWVDSMQMAPFKMIYRIVDILARMSGVLLANQTECTYDDKEGLE